MKNQDFCNNSAPRLEEIRTFKLAFESTYKQAVLSGVEKDIKEAQEMKVDLVEKIKNFNRNIAKEWLKLFDPNYLPSIENKGNYTLSDTIKSENKNTHTWGAEIGTFQVLSDTSVVFGSSYSSIFISTKISEGIWETKTVGGWDVKSLRVLPDGRIFFCEKNGTIAIYNQTTDKKWHKTHIGKQESPISQIQVLPDGRITSIGSDFNDCHITIWTEIKEGEWQSDTINKTKKLNTFSFLSYDQIVTAEMGGGITLLNRVAKGNWEEEVISKDEVIFIEPYTPECFITSNMLDVSTLTKQSDGTWSHEKIFRSLETINTLQVLPDGRMVLLGISGKIFIWTKKDNKWRNELIIRDENTKTLKVTQSGKIFSGCSDGSISIWDGEIIQS